MKRLRAVLLGLAIAAALVVPAPATVQRAVAVSSGWTTYHYDNARDGNDTGEPSMGGSIQNTWTSSTVDGSIYAEPLVYAGLVYIATENNTIYALNETTGAVVWSHHLATPVAGSSLYCGNIGTVGITGTPVIDSNAQVIYAVGLVVDGSQPSGMKYQLFSLHLGDGTTASNPRDLVFADVDPRAAGERAAIALAGGNVYVPLGGRWGDCSPYHPIVVAAPTSGAAPFEWDGQSGGQDEAGIWAAGGEAVDGGGNVYVVTGNGSSGGSTPCNNGAWDHGNSIVKLNANLQQQDFYAPSDWCSLSASDQDLGGAGPVLLSNGGIFAGGKDGKGYVVNTAGMGQFNGPAGAHIPNCATGDAIFGSFAFDGAHVYVPCDNMGVAALVPDTSNWSYWVLWEDNGGYSAGPPIVAGGYVWSLTQNGGRLHRLDPNTGASTTYCSSGCTVSQPIGGTTRFMTPTADSGRIFIAQTNTVRELNFGNVTPPTNVPGAPAGVQATAGNGYATLSWTAPSYTGSGPITGYRVTPVGGTPRVFNGSATSAVFTGLTDGAAYSFTVAAINAYGTGPDSAPSNPVTPNPPAAGVYVPVTPFRILDTRQCMPCGAPIGPYTTPFGPGTVRNLQITGGNGIPASGVTAVVLNVTAVDTTESGFFTVYADGSNRPNASNVNFVGGQTVANQVQVALGSNGQIDLYNYYGSADMVIDVAGYFKTGGGSAGLLMPLSPVRIMDTRSSGGYTPIGPFSTPFATNQTRPLTIGGGALGGVPACASGVVLNVTATDTTQDGFLTLFPDGAARPNASNVNWSAGQTVPNRVYVKIASNGAVDVYNYNGSTDVIIDVNGYFSDGSGGCSTGNQYYSLPPARIIDTRQCTPCGAPIGPYSSPLTGGATDTVTVAGSGALLPATAGAQAVVANVTATDTTQGSFFTLWPSGNRPNASDLNWVAAQTVPNLCVTELSSGQLQLYNYYGSADAIIDVDGYYAP